MQNTYRISKNYPMQKSRHLDSSIPYSFQLIIWYIVRLQKTPIFSAPFILNGRINLYGHRRSAEIVHIDEKDGIFKPAVWGIKNRIIKLHKDEEG